MPRVVQLLFKLSSRVEAAIMAAAIAHSISSVAPEKAMEYDSIYIEHMAEILVIIKQLESINNGKSR